MVSVGQTLWGINKETGNEETVEVIEVGTNYFRVAYKGLKCRYPFSVVNSIFYAEPRRKKSIQQSENATTVFCVTQEHVLP